MVFGASACLILVVIGTLNAAQDGQEPNVVDGPPPFRGEAVFARLLARAKADHWTDLPTGEIMGKVGMELLDTPYAPFTLERWGDHETCSVDLTGLDCVTFYEDCLGFARMLKHGGDSPSDLLKEVRFTRYRGGRLTDYSSRLHYTSDWIYDNALKGTVKILAPGLPGSERFDHPVNFMSEHPDSYRQLAASPDLASKIAGIEQAINARETFYVPVDKVAEIEPLLQTGDIVGMTTRVSGLDCSHTGFCIRDAFGVVHMIDASQSKGKVVLEGRISEYLHGRCSGIMLARPL
jgi:hypothetical protein